MIDVGDLDDLTEVAAQALPGSRHEGQALELIAPRETCPGLVAVMIVRDAETRLGWQCAAPVISSGHRATRWRARSLQSPPTRDA
ncbi:hypothetical protein [Geodermatophilus marinus]|uniref:hypothetical protein n=1 Tax=Geodermatophilus sp. LHW52908 TaxID=2303986 RepID=UPI0011C1264C|nr:hypothetical protein [Geodermatophilus sp. LHW52908]